MTTATATKSKRRLLRFSLRALLLLMLIVCITLGWKVEKARKQREAVTWVQQSGGWVKYDYEWLKKFVGLDFFHDVVAVEIHNSNKKHVSDVTPLAGLTSLEALHLSSTRVSDVTPLAGLTSLKRLQLYGTQVSDVTPLAGLTSLKRLYLGRTQVSKEDYNMLRKALPNCRID